MKQEADRRAADALRLANEAALQAERELLASEDAAQQKLVRTRNKRRAKKGRRRAASAGRKVTLKDYVPPSDDDEVAATDEGESSNPEVIFFLQGDLLEWQNVRCKIEHARVETRVVKNYRFMGLFKNW